MSTSTSTSLNRSSADVNVDTTPLLNSAGDLDDDRSRRRRSIGGHTLREAARFLRRASSRRLTMGEPSMLDDRQGDWTYSRPIVVLDMVWNFAFVVVAAVVLVLSRTESPPMPLRLWIVGYAMQCLVHMVCVCVEFQRGRRRWRSAEEGVRSGENSSSGSRGVASNHYVTLADVNEEAASSVAKHLESGNTMFSFVWWIIGFYWVSAGGQAFARDSPQLYWLCIIFLAFEVFFVVFCFALACVIGIAVCCCLPCIIAVLYAVADQRGASKQDIEQLPKYKFRRVGDIENLNGEIEGPFAGVMTECGTDSPMEHNLSTENAECRICLSAYDDATELRELPCHHYFHSTCVDKWLIINATCPLCKYNILKSNGNHDNEEV